MANDLENFYNYALRFLSYRPRSQQEISNKLKEKKVSPEIIDKIIAKLIEKKFINDEEFAKGWIESRLRFKPRSARLIKLELKQKGIEQDIIDNLINDAPLRQGFEGQEGLMINDLESAKKLVEKKIGRFRNKFGMTRNETYQKLGRYLASKGFDWDTIKKAVDYVRETERS